MTALVDRFGRVHTYLRVSVTDRCNLRCRYCMPQEGIEWKKKEEILTFEEIVRISQVFANLGIRKVRITGGEPLVRKELDSLIRRLSAIPGIETIAMTTNAVLLPGKTALLKKAGVSALNISLDSLRSERFRAITRRDDHDKVMGAIFEALETRFRSLKLNVVVMSGVNDDEILDFVDFTRDKEVNVRFIEYMPFKDNQWTSAGLFSFADMRASIQRRYELVPLQTEHSAVAKDFRIPGFAGTVSFITSMTNSFCRSCNRLRLTADGSIKSCLFFPAEVNVRDDLRGGISDQSLAALIKAAVLLKPPEHPPVEEIVASENRAMVEIGG